MVMDLLLGWTLYLHPALAILIVSILISVFITLALKYFTDQTMMKGLREEMNEMQKKMRNMKSNPEKAMKLNQRLMDANLKYMSASMKPTIITFLPIILVFGWLNSHLGYYPLEPGRNFTLTATFRSSGGVAAQAATLRAPEGLTILETVTKQIESGVTRWELSGAEGRYTVSIDFGNNTYNKSIVITSGREYAPPVEQYKKSFFSPEKGGLDKIELSNAKVMPFVDVPIIRDIPWVGTWGWLGVYFVFSIGFSILFRKLFNVY